MMHAREGGTTTASAPHESLDQDDQRAVLFALVAGFADDPGLAADADVTGFVVVAGPADDFGRAGTAPAFGEGALVAGGSVSSATGDAASGASGVFADADAATVLAVDVSGASFGAVS